MSLIIAGFFLLTGCAGGNGKNAGDTTPGTDTGKGTQPYSTSQSSTASTTPTPSGTPSSNENPGGTLSPGDAAIYRQIQDMPLDDRIGQLLFLGFEGKTWDSQTASVISSYKPGGIVIMGENVESAGQLHILTNKVRQAGAKNPVPLFISVDEEGGRVSRMPAGLLKLPAALDIGRTGNPQLAYEFGGVTSEKLKAFGFNMDFAPVLDIFSNPKNTVIGNRAFGTDPDTVSSFGLMSMKGISSKNIIPVVKHFPGHGDTLVDSHIGLPVVDYNLNRLQSFEFIPFENAIKSGADAVMIAHILLPRLDPSHPSSLSKTIVTDILRKQLNFGGVVITDDLTMGAIKENYGIGEAAKMAVEAGCDMVLVAHEYDSEAKVAAALKKAVSSGEISEARINESVFRILKLKTKYNIENNQLGQVNVSKLNNDAKTVLDKFGKY